MKTLAIILIVNMVVNAVLGIVQHKVEKDIDMEIGKGVEMMRKWIHDDIQKSMHNEDSK